MKLIFSLLDWLGWERVSEIRARHNDIINRLILMAENQTQLNDALKALSVKADKIAAEQAKRADDLNAVIVKLTEQIQNGTVTPEVNATLAELETKFQALDDSIPDAPSQPA